MFEPKNFDALLDSSRTVLDQLVISAPFLKGYTLVGGSALSLYFCHRKSEDLDFFTWEDSFNRDEILHLAGMFDPYEVINDNKDQLDLMLNGVKVTFFNARWGFLRPEKPSQLNIAKLESIAAMKVNTLFLRAKFRDYYDLYFLAKNGMSLKKIFSCAQPIVSGLNFKLFCIALTYIEDIEDDNIEHLQPVENVNKQDIREFFEKQIREQIRS